MARRTPGVHILFDTPRTIPCGPYYALQLYFNLFHIPCHRKYLLYARTALHPHFQAFNPAQGSPLPALPAPGPCCCC